MIGPETSAVAVEREMERLRQEMETFNQRKLHESRWFSLRLVMGYSSVVLLTFIMAIASYILLRSSAFSATVVASAGAALFVDVVGLIVGVYKIVLNPEFMTKLAPVTETDMCGSDGVLRYAVAPPDDGLPDDSMKEVVARERG